METRVLTLFDDEDFFSQQEATKKTASKTTAAKKKAESGNEAGEEPASEADFVPGTDTAPQSIEQESANSRAETMPEHPEEVEEDKEQGIIPDTKTISSIPPMQADGPHTEEELGKQMLQELAMQDYTVFIHKDYPFDIQQASVISKDREQQPQAASEEFTTEEETFEEVVPLPEWNLDKKYYTIGEVAQLFSVNTSHIRFWTNEFKLKPRTTRKGDRLYSPKDIAELRLIHHLVKEKKHTIRGAREKLKVEKAGVHQKLDLKESLTLLRNMLVQIREQL